MKKLIGVKIRLYPTVKQKQLLENHFDGYRYAYNLCLEYKSLMWSAYKIRKSAYDMQNELFDIRKEIPWLLQCKAECIREAAMRAELSFKNFYSGSGYPKFKSKKGEQSFYAHQSIKSANGKIRFYGAFIKYSTSEKLSLLLDKSKIKTISFKRDSCGDYLATCLIESNDKVMPKSNGVVGIDLGIKDLVVTSKNKVYENKKFLINTKFKITKLQRKFAKSRKDGSNRYNLRTKIAKLHRKCTRQREHYYHQITNDLIRDNQTIVVENLKVSNLVKNHKLARSISDVSWSILINMLTYKAIRHERELITIGTYFPSSKTCSGCGNVKEKVLLSERTYSCDCCGLSLDRDLNAAINIKNEGLRISGLPVENTVNRQVDEAGSKRLTATTILKKELKAFTNPNRTNL